MEEGLVDEERKTIWEIEDEKEERAKEEYLRELVKKNTTLQEDGSAESKEGESESEIDGEESGGEGMKAELAEGQEQKTVGGLHKSALAGSHFDETGENVD